MHNRCLKDQVHKLHDYLHKEGEWTATELASLQRDLKATAEENTELKRRIRDLNQIRSNLKSKVEELTKQQAILLQSGTPDHDQVQELISHIERQRDIYKTNVERLIGKLDPDGTRLEKSLNGSSDVSVVESPALADKSSKRITIKSKKTDNNVQVLKDIQNQSRKMLRELQREGKKQGLHRFSPATKSTAEISEVEGSYHASQYENTLIHTPPVRDRDTSSGTDNARVSKEHVDRILLLEKEVKSMQETLSQLRREKQEAEEVLQREVEKFSVEKASLMEEIELLRSGQREAARRQGAAEKFPSSLSELKRRLAEQDAAMSDLETQVKTKQKHLLQMSDEKDKMQSLLDDKTVELVDSNRRLSAAESAAATAEADKTVAEQRLHQCLGEVSKLHTQLEAEESRSKALREKQTAERTVGLDLHRVNEDLKEQLHRRNQEVTRLQGEIAELNENVNRYVTEVKRTEELLALREKERSELLEQYKHLSEEISTAETYGRKMAAKVSILEMLLIYSVP